MERQVDSPTPLDIAIDTVSESRLRNLFKSLCEMSSETRRLATERLLVDTSETGKETGADGEKEDNRDGNGAEKKDVPQADSTPATQNLKRPVSRYSTCENCETEFDVTTNSSQSCIYHPEDAEPTEEMYEDIYEGDELFEIDSPEMRRDFPDLPEEPDQELEADNIHEVDTPEMRKEFTHLFIFECCGGNLAENPDGCVSGWHAIDGATEERVRDILRLLCKVSADAQRIATGDLLVDARKKREAGHTDLEDNSEAETDAPDSESERTDDSEVQYLGSTTTPRAEGAPASGAVIAVPEHEPARLKRLVPRYAFCENCKEEFDVTENRSNACTYHRLDCEPTGNDLWVDNEFGVEDTPELRRRYPHCYEFECCGETLEDNPEGCETGWHEEGSYEPPTKISRTYHYQPSF
ncbi:hypothetical protein BJX65DRAFT_312271 [Aspergillus insuetus]